MISVVVIGFGAIGQEVVAGLQASPIQPLHLAVLVRDGSSRSRALPNGIVRLRNIDDILSFGPSIVVEAAGPDSVRTYAKPCLEAGASFLISSAGTLTDDGLREDLIAAARHAGGKVLIPSGALGALDYLSAVRSIPGTQVYYESRKPPAAWHQELKERAVDPQLMNEPLHLFSGTARQAAQLFPKNLNVAATLALAGFGMDDTRVDVVVDPSAQGNTHTVRISGPAGSMETRIYNRPSPDNPKTSWVVGKSIVALIERQLSPISLG